jgi:hypothetical protein
VTAYFLPPNWAGLKAARLPASLLRTAQDVAGVAISPVRYETRPKLL